MFRNLMLVAMVAVSGTVFADEGSEKIKFSADGELRVQKGWIDPLLSREMHHAWAARQDIRFRFPNGLSVSGWESLGLESTTQPGAADEGHLELGWHGAVCDTDVLVSTGMHNMSGPGDRLEQKLEWGVARLYTAAEETWDLRMRLAWVSTTTFNDGAVVLQPYVVNNWEHAFGFERLDLEQLFTFSNDSGFEGRTFENSSKAIHFRWDLKLAWKLSDHAAFAVGYTGVFPLQRGDDGRGQESVVTAGLEFKF